MGGDEIVTSDEIADTSQGPNHFARCLVEGQHCPSRRAARGYERRKDTADAYFTDCFRPGRSRAASITVGVCRQRKRHRVGTLGRCGRGSAVVTLPTSATLNLSDNAHFSMMAKAT